MKYWESIANQLSEAGWTWGSTRFVKDGRYIDVIDAHRGDGQRYIVWSDDRLSAFLELQRLLGDTAAA